MSEEEEVKEEISEETEEVATEEEVAEGEPAPKKKLSKKKKIVIGVVVVVLVCAVAGMLWWHEQPSFCGVICHTPMYEYLMTYESELGEATTDKYGNEVEDSSGMLSVVHAAEGLTCLSCHEPTLSEQISEGIGWVLGNYEYPLTETTLTELTAASGKEDIEFCLNESCHNLTVEELAESTSDLDFNPHAYASDEVLLTIGDTEYTWAGIHEMYGLSADDILCSDCHKAHRASVLTCTECHDVEVPTGWLTYEESLDLTLYEATEE